MTAITESICQFFKFGFCKFGTSCRNKHVATICENIQCDVRNCLLRHPRDCKYFRAYNRCKFDSYCMFKHVSNKTSDARSRFEDNDLEKKIENLEEEVKKLKSALCDLKMKFGDITATVNGRCESSWTTSLGSNFTDNSLVTPARNETDHYEYVAEDLKIMNVDGPGDSVKKSEGQPDSLLHVGLSSFPPWSFKTP